MIPVMWQRYLIIAGVILAVIGYPYAGVLVYRGFGTRTVHYVDGTGEPHILTMGPGAPRPVWLALPSASTLVDAGHFVPKPGQEALGSLEYLTRMSVDDIKRHHLESLRAAGFEVQDLGYGTLNAAAAAFLGIENILMGDRTSTGLSIRVTTLTPQGILWPVRTVQVAWGHWPKTPAAPAQ